MILVIILLGLLVGIILGVVVVLGARWSHKANQYRVTHGFNKYERTELKADSDMLNSSRRERSERNYKRGEAE